jgi:hypothetical protein
MRWLCLGFATLSLLALVAGCGDDSSTTAAKPKIKTRQTINKTTQNVLKLDEALKDGGQFASTKISVSDPLTQAAEAHRTINGRISVMSVDYAIKIYHAANDGVQEPKPLTYDEFMSEIIKKGRADGIQLPMLPYYQEYAWDEPNQCLVVVEFPQKKKDFQDQQDRELGRK